jgi:hypothetical protein
LITFTRPPRDVEELLGSADALIYEAKAAGGNCLRKARVGTPTLVAVDGSVVAALTP